MEKEIGAVILGKVSKGIECSVKGCNEEASRSVPSNKAVAAKLQVTLSRRSYLCKSHYKQYKKATKKEKTIEKWRYRT